MPRDRSLPSPGQLAQDVLAAVRKAGHAGITSQQLALQLGFKDKGQRYLIFDALDALLDAGKVQSGKKGRFTSLGGSDAIEGRIDIIASGAGYVRVEGGEEDIFVHTRNVGMALHGDTVLVKVSGGRGSRAEGKVMEVLKRRRTEFVGTVHKQQGRLLLVPDDQRVKRPFFIPADSALGAKDGDKAIIELGEWKDTRDLPRGKVVRVLAPLIGYLMARALYDAAERGVRVRLLLDDMNAKDKDALMMALDAHPNIEIRLYNPFRNRSGIARTLELVQRAFSVNHRMHNKSWIADGRIAIVGGRNIGEEYFSARSDVNFQDLDLLVAGPAVEQANRIFDDYWNSGAAIPISALAFYTDAQLRLLVRASDHEAQRRAARPYLQRVAESRHRQRPSPEPLHWSGNIRILSDPPMKHRDDDRSTWLVSALVGQLRSAHHKALLISPYFVPGNEGLEGLSAMSARGVQVGVVTNSLAANDVAAVHGGYMGYRVPLLKAGVHLYELKAQGRSSDAGLFGSSGASLHTKAFIVDDRRGFVGSFNLDPRSAYLNTEMGVQFDDPVLGARLREEYLRLAGPQHSWWLSLGPGDQLRWLEREPPVHWVPSEPGATPRKRGLSRVISWLPVESQL